MKAESIKENLLALVIAIVIAAVLMFAISRTGLLTADITQEQENGEELQGDVVLSIKDGNININSNKKIEGVSSLSVNLSFDNNKYDFNLEEDVNSDYEIVGSINNGVMSIMVDETIGTIEKGDNLISIKVPNKGNDIESKINISSATVNFTDGSAESLSISNKK